VSASLVQLNTFIYRAIFTFHPRTETKKRYSFFEKQQFHTHYFIINKGDIVCLLTAVHFTFLQKKEKTKKKNTSKANNKRNDDAKAV
jgi:hypothetical protein